MSTVILCLVRTLSQVEHVIDELTDAGFSRDDVSALLPDRQWASDSGMLGGVLARLPGLTPICFEGLGPFIAAGPIISAQNGNLAAALARLGVTEADAKLYEGGMRQGNRLIAVYARTQAQRRRAQLIFADAAADDIASFGRASTGRAA